MTNLVKYFFHFSSLALSVSLIVLAVGCGAVINVPGEKQPPTTVNVAEMGPGSMRIEVTDYSWSYLNGNTHVNIIGTVVNNTGSPVQGVTLIATLYDHSGKPVAYGETYIRPSYLNTGATGTFDFVALVTKSSGIKATRLITIARPMSGF
jgi:hypothetical protein